MADSFYRPLRVFLCHSSGDKPTVRELYRRLDAEGWIDVWLDEEKLLPGQDWEYEIEKALDNSDAVIVTLSTGSVSKEGYVQKELRFVLDIALEKPEGTIYILPVRLDDCERPRRLRSIQGIDYFPPERREWAYTRLLRSLKLRAERLNLVTETLEKPTVPGQISPLPATPRTAESTTSYPSVGPKRSGVVARLLAAIRRIPIWKYVRILVILLLFSGFFGPWFEITGCSQAAPQETPEGSPSAPAGSIVIGYQEYFELISSKSISVIIPLLVAGLFLLTLMRLIPGKFRDHDAVVRSERLTAALALIAMSVERFFGTFVIFGSAKVLWGFWLSIASVYLAPINIILEKVSTMRKGQKWPRWVWLLIVSIIIAVMVPWLIIWLFTLYSWFNQ